MFISPRKNIEHQIQEVVLCSSKDFESAILLLWQIMWQYNNDGHSDGVGSFMVLILL